MSKTIHQVLSQILAKDLKGKNGRLTTSTENLGAIIDVALKAVEKGKDVYDTANTTKEHSLSQVASVASVEPRVIIEDTLKTQPQMGEFLMTLSNIFMGYYLQSIALTAPVRAASALGILDRLNPNRELLPTLPTKFYKQYNMPGFESFMHGYTLPNYKKELNKPLFISNEADSAESNKIVEKISETMDLLFEEGIVTPEQLNSIKSTWGNLREKFNDGKNLDYKQLGPEINKLYQEIDSIDAKNASPSITRHLNDLKGRAGLLINALRQNIQPGINNGLKMINDANNLAVGRWIDVSLFLGDRQVNIPVALRMRPMFAPQLIMRELVAYGDIKESWTERWYRFKSGELSFKDWMLQSDRIRHQKKLVALDKDGILMDMIKRRSTNFAAAMKTGQPSLGAASAMFIVNKDTMDYVQAMTGHSFENEDVRELFFAANSAMMLVVLDLRWERVITYTRGVKVSSDYAMKDFAKFGKGNGPDIMEIFKMYQMGAQPRF